MNKRKEFLAAIQKAIDNGNDFAVAISNPNHPEPEVIINPHANLEYKKKYYSEAYDIELHHKHDSKVTIAEYTETEGWDIYEPQV